MKPKISIVTINYNDAVGLEKTMRSVASQSYEHLEYIVVDGGSTDGSVAVIEKYSNSITHWLSEKDNGIYHAMNKGIDMSSGHYVLFLNSGDYLISETILDDVFVESVEKSVLYGAIETVKNGKKGIKEYPENLTLDFLIEKSLPHPATFYKRELFEKYGHYNESLKIVGDWAFNLNILGVQNESYRKINKVITVFNMDGVSSNPDFKEQVKDEGMKVLNELFPAPFVAYIKEFRELKLKHRQIKQSKWVKLLYALKLLND